MAFETTYLRERDGTGEFGRRNSELTVENSLAEDAAAKVPRSRLLEPVAVDRGADWLRGEV